MAERYQIVSLLGRGGMGDVYRADDLRLGQPVALKFLTGGLAEDPERRERLIAEVRVARQVTHPNVCRVHDIGEFDKYYFITMEFIDGEDLASLLRRIGRLHGAKALDIARQLCAGLSAAHDRGVLHRDLKPANVMIDGRGLVRIMDFGLAISTSAESEAKGISGTPAYMAPEQFSGKEASIKSDIYALGLVLYELYTGCRAFPERELDELVSQKKRGTSKRICEIAHDVDPIVERLIMQCLDVDAERRPGSAAQVLAALPGSDALRAAMAAGITPSPEMVAAAGESAGLRPIYAALSLAVVIVGLALLIFLGGYVNWSALLLREYSPDMLALKARDLIKRLGYADPRVDTAWGLTADIAYAKYLRLKVAPRMLRDHLLRGQPSAAYFWYRENPQLLRQKILASAWSVTQTSPPLEFSGMVAAKLDPSGRLLAFTAVPPQLESAQGSTSLPDWDALFAAAGLDRSRFAAADPKWAPPVAFDNRVAWTGVYPEQPAIPLRLEAASYHGKIVYFDAIGPWAEPVRMTPTPTTASQSILQVFAALLVLTYLAAAMLLARYNIRRGRGDRQGARRLAFFLIAVDMLKWLFGASHISGLAEAGLFVMAAVVAAIAGGLTYVTYLALEPFVRRRWPMVMICWSRVLSGKWRDASAGRGVLNGILFGIGFMLLQQLGNLALIRTGSPLIPSSFDSWLKMQTFISNGIFGSLESSIMSSLFIVFLILLLGIVTRRQWLAIALFIAIFTSAGALLVEGVLLVKLPAAALMISLIVVVLLRRGLLALATTMFVQNLLNSAPISADFSAWYGGNVLAALVAVLAISLFALHASLGGQPIFRIRLLEE